MPLSRYEQEVVINFNAEEEKATIYTANQVWIRKMDKILSANPEQFKQIGEEKMEGKVVSKTFEFPKELITIRTKKKVVQLSEDQRAILSERLKRSKMLSS